ncbi:ATP synthase mitochondrial F1 complex assembly factor 2-like [Babylonia areolata]|uniref:ATP synthase mitochondrial F1 complex assembly factor 2-like n=1 Tax=Babylonia areolata TaxID=304850 RepID=UPI003FD4DD17
MAAPLTVILRRLTSLTRHKTAKLPTFEGSQTWKSSSPYGCIRPYTNIREVKKFYRNASIATADGWYEVNLDKRKLRTPAGNLFRVPNEAMALAVATEWNAQEKTVKRHNMHLTNLCNTALDNPLQKNRHKLTEYIVSILETDTIFYRLQEPPELNELQAAQWDPILQWANDRYNLTLASTYGITIPHVTKESKDIIRRHLLSYSDWALFGYEYAVDNVRSLLLVMALMDRHITVEKAVELATLENLFQAQRWGSIEWLHDVDKYELQSRLAAATLFVHWCSENTTVRQKASLPVS